MAKIFAPNKYYTGISANVVFKDGVGETSDPHLIRWFKSKGYTVEGAVEPVAEEEKVIEPAEGPKAEEPKAKTEMPKKPQGKPKPKSK